jgi:hypothetical protein
MAAPRIIEALDEIEYSKARFARSLEAMLDEQLTFENCVEALRGGSVLLDTGSANISG